MGVWGSSTPRPTGQREANLSTGRPGQRNAICKCSPSCCEAYLLCHTATVSLESWRTTYTNFAFSVPKGTVALWCFCAFTNVVSSPGTPFPLPQANSCSSWKPLWGRLSRARALETGSLGLGSAIHLLCPSGQYLGALSQAPCRLGPAVIDCHSLKSSCVCVCPESTSSASTGLTYFASCDVHCIPSALAY